jgi:hypothetical protein
LVVNVTGGPTERTDVYDRVLVMPGGMFLRGQRDWDGQRDE